MLQHVRDRVMLKGRVPALAEHTVERSVAGRARLGR